MPGLFLRLLGGRILHKTVAQRAGSRRAFDVRFGISLLRDRRVPLRSKLLAFGLGAGLMALLIALELPLEGMWGVLLPIFGFGMDAMVDGFEAVVGPILLGAALLPLFVPKPLLARIQNERDGLLPDTIIDVA